MIPRALALAAAVGLGAVSAWVGGSLGGWLGIAAWVVPAAVGLGLRTPWESGFAAWRRTGWLVAGWLPAGVVAGTVGLVCLAGLATWDPGGVGLRGWWASTEAGRTALEVSALHTLALGQAGLVTTAPVYALPLGLAAASTVEGEPPWRAALWLGGLCGALGLAGVIPAGPETWLGTGVGAAAWGALGGAAIGRSPWATAGVIAGLHGLGGLGPLLAYGSPWVVGYASVPALVAATVGIIVALLWGGPRADAG